jgi:hypothetical protein
VQAKNRLWQRKNDVAALDFHSHVINHGSGAPCPNFPAFTALSSACFPSHRNGTTLPIFTHTIRSMFAVFSIAPVALVAGLIPQQQQRLVEAWAELLVDWNLLQEGRRPAPIAPLQ